MFVRQVPRVVQGFLSAVSDQLGGPQVRHLNLAVWGASGFVDSPVSYFREACLVSNSVGVR